MNNNELKVNNNETDVYQTTPNFNTAIENPNININGVMDVNIENIEEDHNYMQSLGNNGAVVSQNFNAMNQNVNIVDYSNINNNQIGGQSLNIDGNSGVVTTNMEQIPLENVAVNNSVTDMAINNVNSNQINNTNDNNNISNVSVKDSYRPVLDKKKKPATVSFRVSKEVITTVIIIVILLLFISCMPYIYDFFHNFS